MAHLLLVERSRNDPEPNQVDDQKGDDGHRISPGEDHSFLGDGSLLPGFERLLFGLNAGERQMFPMQTNRMVVRSDMRSAYDVLRVFGAGTRRLFATG